MRNPSMKLDNTKFPAWGGLLICGRLAIGHPVAFTTEQGRLPKARSAARMTGIQFVTDTAPGWRIFGTG